MSWSQWSNYYQSSEARVAFLTQQLDPLIWRPVLKNRGVFVSRERPLACDFDNLDDAVLELIVTAIAKAAAAVGVVVGEVHAEGCSSLGYELVWPPRE